MAAAVAVVPLAVSAPGSAAPVRAQAASVVPCPADSAAKVAGRSARKVPLWRQASDTSAVSQADLDALPAQETSPGFVAREVTPKLAARVWIPVYAHVITGRHTGERKGIGPRRIRHLVDIMNKAMAGQQSDLSTPTRYRFSVKKVNYTRRDGWYHAYLYGTRDQRMKRRLHRGGADALNLYINGGGPRNYPVLGWSRFPWQYERTPKLDGITVNVAALPGGKARGYNLGDTIMHETGHWLGLLHTFEGGCDSRGDLVADTASEAEPSYECETTRDTCTEPGLDPVHNFMDYSFDSCMDMLTAGQVRRMDAAFENWRQ
ncbi:MAG: zinc metalloprotease [Marmoricola sp.]